MGKRNHKLHLKEFCNIKTAIIICEEVIPAFQYLTIHIMKICSNNRTEYRIINIFLLFVFLLVSCCTVKKVYQFHSYDFEKMYKILYDSYDSQNWSKIENEISFIMINYH